jgi:hypothetical protein
MSINSSAPWHKASFDQFLQERLPQLLAERLPLAGYQTESTGRYTCRVVISLVSNSSDIEIEYTDILQPDEDGLFEIKGQPAVVVPTASQEELEVADIRCVGEQLYAYIVERVGQAPPDLPWDAALAHAWLPLDTWINEFVAETAQRLDAINWISRTTHLRRIIILKREKVVAPGQLGRVCPFETPEGSNIGRVFTVAVGAEIRDGKLVIVDERPEAGLSPTASMIPFLEHSDPNRLLMGDNMMRQWIEPPDSEPALVQTGNEPDAPGFWTGRNLLTAFVAWGADTFSDGIVISESCAQRLNYPYPAEPGDKLGNRHGTKGVVSRVLPDDEMPHLPDGTPVELVYSFYGMHVRMNFGQVREALIGRIAWVEGEPAIVPPFHAPSAEEIRERLVRAGLPESGMETLTLGKDGPKLQRSSTVGWVYWGRLIHLARDKVRKSVNAQEGQMQGELENYALRDLGAYENMREYLNTRAMRRPDADTLADRVASDQVEQAGPPTPAFSDLVARLRIGGIQASLEDDKLTFRFEPPTGDVLKLARPVPHPWLHERELTEIGVYTPAMHAYDAQARSAAFPSWHLGERPPLPADAYNSLIETNDRLARMLSSQTPEKLVWDTVAQLEARVKAFFDALLTPRHLRFRERQLFSGRAVIAPGPDLRLDQVVLADEIAWTLFGPLVVRELGDKEAVRDRTEKAAKALDEVMARSWIVVNRAPSLTPTALLAFHPVRDPAHVIRIHPLVCALLNADFDGDQVAVLLPITEGAQQEARERLSVPAHLDRDPGLIEALLPPYDALWGLVSLSLTEQGREEIAQLGGIQVDAPKGFITQLSLGDAMKKVLERDGVAATLAALERLTRRGFEVIEASGASLSPFVGESLERPQKPESDDPDRWDAYVEELRELLASSTGYANDDLGPQLLAVLSRPQRLGHLVALIGARRPVTDADGKSVIIRHTFVEGLTPEEMYACIAGARRGLAQVTTRWDELSQDVRDRSAPRGFNVLTRARRSRRPGIVFARAAATGEVDPLVDVDSQLFVGLPVTAQVKQRLAKEPGS